MDVLSQVSACHYCYQHEKLRKEEQWVIQVKTYKVWCYIGVLFLFPQIDFHENENKHLEYAEYFQHMLVTTIHNSPIIVTSDGHIT